LVQSKALAEECWIAGARTAADIGSGTSSFSNSVASLQPLANLLPAEIEALKKHLNVPDGAFADQKSTTIKRSSKSAHPGLFDPAPAAPQ
jgi:hypothetical protein